LLGFGAPLLLGLSCSQLVGITDTLVVQGSGGKASAGGDVTSAGMPGGGTSAGGRAAGGAEAGGQGGDAEAPDLHGPTLIDAGGYAVDSTEVTVAQYKEFLKAKAGDVTGQPDVCSWNESYYDAAPMPLEKDTWPIAHVDWCDATAYCSWAGKRLCGAISGGSIPFTDFSDPNKSQWFRACGGPTGLPHPNTDWACNDDGGVGDVAPVGTFPGCEGFYPGLFDLQGNVAEWVDSCNGSSGQDDHCILAGGSEVTQGAFCSVAFTDVRRADTSRYFGFRCCSK
jgi:formylglycine-generating enzyme required for sulfatase activity